MQTISYYYRHPNVIALRLIARYGTWLPDKIFLQLKFRSIFGRWIDLKRPMTFSEKLQWLKLYNRKPEYTIMVDKVRVKEYVANIIGEEFIIPTLGVWTDPEDIDFETLPNKFVLKCNHNSGLGMYICKDKSKMETKIVKEKLREGLNENYYKENREWPYKNVPRRVFAEAYMEDEFGELRDYKFFCFDGDVKAMFIASDRNKGKHAVRFDFFDADFNHLPFTNGHPNSDKPLEKPKMFDKMKDLAAKLSKGLPHVRIDFYEVGNRVLFGEMTFFHWSGLRPYNPIDWDYKFGEWLILPKCSFK